MNDEDIDMLVQVSAKLPGAVRVAMELRYNENAPDAWKKLLELGIIGEDLWLLYKICSHDSRAVLVSLGDGTAKEMLRMHPQSTFYVKLNPAEKEEKT